MKIKQLLLKGTSFRDLLKRFSLNPDEVMIKDEEVVLAELSFRQNQFLKERICIQGKGRNGCINLFGTLYCNLINQRAVFELDFVESHNTVSAA